MSILNQGWSRRRLLKTTAIAGAALAAPAVWTPSRAQGKRIVVRDDGGIYTKAYGAVFYKPFQEATGIEVVGVQANAEPTAQIRSMVDAGSYTWDMAKISQPAILMLTSGDKKYLEPHSLESDPVIATKKGINILDRGHQVHAMAEFEALLDFPPAPKLDILGNLDPAQATEAELRGEKLFFGKAKCSVCHPGPYYTDNLMHNLRVERFFKPQMVNGRMAHADGPIKTFVLRGIKDSPPYLHDGRLLTLEDTVEFFNLVLGTRLDAQEKQDLVAFMRQL